MVEEELAKAQARAEIYENENKIGQSKKVYSFIPWMTLLNDPLYSRDTFSQYVERTPRYIKNRKRGSMQWQQWLIILATYHRKKE